MDEKNVSENNEEKKEETVKEETAAEPAEQKTEEIPKVEKEAETAEEEKKPEEPQQKVKEQPKQETKESKPASSGEKVKKEKKPKGDTPWKSIALILASLIVGFGGGWLGGHLSAKNEIADFREEEQENQSDNDFPGGGMFGSFGNMPSENNGSDSTDSGTSQSNPNKAALGIMVRDTDDGVEIVDFTTGSNASEEGLEKGDIITKLDDTEISSVSELREAISDKEAGDTVSITVTRDGKEQDPVTITLIDNSAKTEHSDFPDEGTNIQG